MYSFENKNKIKITSNLHLKKYIIYDFKGPRLMIWGSLKN